MAFTTINGATAADVVTLIGTDGVDSVVLLGPSPYIVDALGAGDSITIANSANQFNLFGPSSATTVYGGEGNDTISAQVAFVANSFVYGGAGNDTLFAAGASIAATELNGNEGNDSIGANNFGVNAQNSLVLGGANNDTIYVSDVTSSQVNGNKNADFIYVQGSVTSGSIFGGKGIDTISLGTAALTYTNSTVSGADGDDFITATASLTLTKTTISGGTGNDSITMALQATAITVDGGEGDDILTIATGSNGAVTALAGAGADTISTGAGADTIFGGDGNDVISSGDGIDTITGAGGADAITGGLGGDVINYTSLATMGEQTGLSTSTIDSIVGFVSATDRIKTGTAGSGTNFFDGGEIAGASYGVLQSAANTYFTTAGNEARQYYFVDNGANGFLFVKNSTSLGLATASLQLTGVTTIVSGDIIA